MTTWERITSELKLDAINESTIHPHDLRERAHLFHVRDGSGSTEFEFLNLLHAFTLALKPSMALELGTFTGMGALSIASALQQNGFGVLLSVDTEECREARAHQRTYKLEKWIEFIQSDALTFCETWRQEPFDLVFVDSGSGRLLETNALLQRGKLAPGALVMVHDASPFRVNANPSWGEIFEKDCKLAGHTICLSRGVRIMFA